MVDAQKWLDEYFPKPYDRKKIPKLALDSKELEGSLDLRDFVGLKKLGCSINGLTNLNLNNNLQLKYLDISRNVFFKQNLSFLSNLVNLEILHIDNTDISYGLECLPDSL